MKNGTHHWLGDGVLQRETNRKRIEDGTHNWLGGEYQKELVKNGTHRFLGPENNRKRVEDGTHNWLGDGELQRNIQQKRLEEGTHPFQKGAPCVNKQGEIKYVPKSVFDEDDEWISISSKEGKIRVGNTKQSYLKDKVRVVDKEGNTKLLNRCYYDNLKKNKDDTYVSISSKEGQKRRNIDKPHPCKNKVTIVDKDGKIYNIDKELYDNDVYVMVRSKEGQRRLGRDYVKKLGCIDKNGNRISLSREEYEKQKKTDNPMNWDFVVIASLEGKRRRNKTPIPNTLDEFL